MSNNIINNNTICNINSRINCITNIIDYFSLDDYKIFDPMINYINNNDNKEKSKDFISVINDTKNRVGIQVAKQQLFNEEIQVDEQEFFNNKIQVFPKENIVETILTQLINKKNINSDELFNYLGKNLEYIKSGSTGHTFKGISNSYNYAVKIVPYIKKDIYGNEYSPTRPENAELLILKNLSSFVINNQTPHIILPITTIYTDLNYIEKLFKKSNMDNDKCKKYLKEYKKNDYYDKISILISEWANGGDLLDYLRNKYTILKLKEWRIILFQIISTLVVIQTKYPNFRHNDMKANNLLVYNLGITDSTKYFIYNINGKKYIVPNIGIQIKLWDFDFACIGDSIENDKVNSKWANNINISKEKNQYYDIHYFFNTLTRKGFLPDFFINPNINTSLKQFIKRIVPDKLHSGNLISEKGRLLKNIEYITPAFILENDQFFNKMRYK